MAGKGTIRTLPPELLREILGNLSADVHQERDALRAASLSCRDLRAPCQEILFSSIMVSRPCTPHGRYSPYRALLEVLQDSAALLHSIKSVTVCNQSWAILNTTGDATVDEAVIALLNLVATQELESVAIEGWRGRPAPALQEAVIQLIGCPSLRSLYLTFLQIDIATAIKSPHITSLSLIDMFGGPLGPFLFRAPRPSMRQSAPAMNLRRLHVTEDREEIDFVLDVTNGVSLAGLTDLRVWLTPEMFRGTGSFAALLSACAGSVKRLCFDAITAYDAQLNYLSAFSRMLQLEDLAIDCSILLRDDDGRINLYNWLPDALSSLPSPATLRTISIFFNYDNQQDMYDESSFWQRVEAVLVEKQAFPHFAKLSVRLGMPFGELSPPSVAGHFPLLYAANMVSVDPESAQRRIDISHLRMGMEINFGS